MHSSSYLCRKRLKTDGARDVYQRQNKRLFSCQKCQHTKEGDSTNAHSVARHHGYRQDAHLPNQFTKNAINFLEFYEKFVDIISII